jgi:hypothetical protein
MIHYLRPDRTSAVPENAAAQGGPAVATGPDSVVYVVDDDESIRRSLARNMRAAGLTVETFSSAQAFLAHDLPDRVACLVLDVRGRVVRVLVRPRKVCSPSGTHGGPRGEDGSLGRALAARGVAA